MSDKYSPIRRRGEAALYADPVHHMGRRPTVGMGRNQAWHHYNGVAFDDDDIYALVTNPTSENMQLFDQKYGQGQAQSTLQGDADGYDWGIEPEITMMRGPMRPRKQDTSRSRGFDDAELQRNPSQVLRHMNVYGPDASYDALLQGMGFDTVRSDLPEPGPIPMPEAVPVEESGVDQVTRALMQRKR